MSSTARRTERSSTKGTIIDKKEDVDDKDGTEADEVPSVTITLDPENITQEEEK